MLSNIFIEALNMSITSGYCILLVFLVRLGLKRQPKIYSYALWSIPFLRLICPVSFQSIFSLVRINRQVIPREIAIQKTPKIQSGFALIDDTVNHAAASSPLMPQETYSVNPLQIILPVAAVIWLTVIAGILFYSILSTWKLYRRLRTAANADYRDMPILKQSGKHTDAKGGILFEKYPVYEAEGIPTAFVLGVFCPKIYLPAGLPPQERQYVLLHEYTHIRRRDYIIKIIAFLTAAVHWFNPLVWLAYFCMENDMEMSCDESVVVKFGKEIKKEYSEALLSLAAGHRRLQGSPLAFGEGKVGGRVRNILRYKKRTLAVTIVLAAVVIVVAAGLMSNVPQEENPSSNVTAETAPEIVDIVGQADIRETEDFHLDEMESVTELITTYATAFCNRDGNTIAELYVSPEAALQRDEMDLVDGNIYTFGYSSPWPWDTEYHILYRLAGNMAEIYYYARTSDPTTTVWKETVYYTETDEGYRIVNTLLKYCDRITTLEEFYDAYFFKGSYIFSDLVKDGTLEAIRYQMEHDHESGIYKLFLQPDTAAEYILHLYGGTSEAEADAQYQTTVTYRFADGSSIEILMYQPNAEGGRTVGEGHDIWLVDFETMNGWSGSAGSGM